MTKLCDLGIDDSVCPVGWAQRGTLVVVGSRNRMLHGGVLSIASFVLVNEVDDVVTFYGVPSEELIDLSQAKAHVQAHLGELNSFVSFSDVTAAKALEE